MQTDYSYSLGNLRDLMGSRVGARTKMRKQRKLLPQSMLSPFLVQMHLVLALALGSVVGSIWFWVLAVHFGTKHNYSLC